MTLGAILMILAGLGLMAYGLFFFYAWLPILYGLVGFEIGALLGVWMTGDSGWLALILGVAGAILLAGASYFLEPFRRILLGISAGFMLGIGLANAFGFGNSFGGLAGVLFAVVLGYAGGIALPRVFDRIVVAVTAASGAAMIMNGAHLLVPGVTLFDRSGGRLLPALLTIGLAIVGVFWQMSNIPKWIEAAGLDAYKGRGD